MFSMERKPKTFHRNKLNNPPCTIIFLEKNKNNYYLKKE
jgi:hypothetical protein